MSSFGALHVIRRDSVWYAASIFLSGLASLISIILVKQQLGNSGYAFFSIILNTTLVGIIVGQGWITQSTIRFAQKAASGGGLSSLRSMRYGLAGSLVITTGITIVLLLARQPHWIIPVICILLPGSLNAVLAASAQGIQQPRVFFYSEGIRSLVLLTGISAPHIFSFNADVFYYAGCYGAGYSAAVVFLVVRLYASRHLLIKGIKPAITLKQLLHFGMPMLIWLAGNYAMTLADRYSLLRQTDPASLGNYTALADILIRATGFLLSPLVTAAYPVLAAIKDNTPAHSLRRILLKLLLQQAGLVAISVVAYGLFYPILFRWLSIPQELYSMLVWCGFFLILAGGLWQMGTLLQKPLEIGGKTMQLMLLVLGCVVVTYLFNYIFIPLFGLAGAPLAYVCGCLAYLAGIAWLLKSSLKGLLIEIRNN